MTPRQFFDLVVEMREAQKGYFKYRDGGSLQTAKTYEKMVDDEIKRVFTKIQSPELPFAE